jgi:hypothetical protein
MEHNGIRSVSRLLAVSLLAGLMAVGAVNARAQVDLFTIAGQPVTLSAIEQNREEVWSWFNPGLIKGRNYDNQYNFMGSWIRVGAGYQLDGIKGFAELMSPYFLNLPDNAIAPAPQGNLGLGANYYQPHGNPDDASVFLKQAFVEFRGKPVRDFDFKGGRFEFFDGSEYLPPDDDQELLWLVKNRIAQRLIANFQFSDVMRSFDGAIAAYGNSKWQATAMYGVPTKGVFDLNGMNELRDIDVAYGSVNAGPGLFASKLWGSSLLRLFYIFYDDGRGLTLVDNRSTTGKPDTGSLSIDTVGADYVRKQPAGPGIADLVLWTAGQFGKWGVQRQQAYAAVAEIGYRLEKAAWSPWLRLGYTVGSGDGSSSNSTHSTFFQILPTPRIYAFFPFFNMMNIDDAMGQLILSPRPDMEIQASAHGLWLDSAADLWYSGGGAYDNRYFGYTGRPSFGHSYLATLTDCQFTWQFSRHLAIELYYGHAFGGNVIGAIYPSGREGNFGFVQTTWTL